MEVFVKKIFILLSICVFSIDLLVDTHWPVPYKRFSNRPKNDPFCQAKYTFCPTGKSKDTVPSFDDDDTIDVFALKAPVWEFKYGALLKIFNIMHDAIGFRSHKSNINYTVEWYELDQLFNCTFPHLVNTTELTWCNQGASCFYQGIDDAHWRENGTLVKVAEMTGKQFKNYTDYLMWDNRTGIYYETWKVMDKIDGKTWFEPHDCATFVINSFQKMGELGVKFNRTVSLKYTMILILSDMPQYLGNISQVRKNPDLYKEILHFYKLFQVPHGFIDGLEDGIKIILELFIKKQFYLFYNYEYWYLQLRSPFFKLEYVEVPLPE